MTSKKRFSRRKLREKVLQALYAFELTKDEPQFIIDTLFNDVKEKNPDSNFAVTLFKLVINEREYYNKEIKDFSKNWDVKRIAILDKILLQMGMCELLHFEDIPPNVTFNEVIELAKSYSTDKSPKFINGILNAFMEKVSKSENFLKLNKLKKL